MDGIYRTNVCGIEVAFYTSVSDEETDAIVERVRERIRTIMTDAKIAVSKASVMACLEAEEETARLEAEVKKLREENEKLSAQLSDMSVKSQNNSRPYGGYKY